MAGVMLYWKQQVNTLVIGEKIFIVSELQQ